MPDPRVAVVVLTHNRAGELCRTLQRLQALPERPRLIVVDNGSTDDTAARVRSGFAGVELVRCAANVGAAGRNAGVARVETPYVAFCDDDTWWAAGALAHAADLLDEHPRLALVSARVLVGAEERLDPTCERMANSPLDSTGLPGPALIAFMAGAVVMRTEAYRAVGGYEARLFLGAEEALMALDLAALGWRMVYAAEVVTHHHPSPARDPRTRRIVLARNRLWIAWMRLPVVSACEESVVILREVARQRLLRPVLRQALGGLVWALARRDVLPAPVLEMYRRVFGRRLPRLPSAGAPASR
jgi:GT2 family glycosyltransferase